ncbi:expressed unknown protein [Ectocarpus siliculosus]|uniref:SPIN90/Ldb17 leucine-rich domain-containing protein n=1 Tax=Ectocarpus siliculosus TaxID=2880 RepID=D7G065_ECTSI|nr:expressed unknown protein [Ectocarpus siliculosus]|eukprot:CBJ32947.1 expressed unknown protein [Ectocarpus siliculosus]
MYYYCNRATGEAQWENPAPQQTTSDRGPPPPYSPTLEAQQHGKSFAYNGNTSGAAAAAAAATAAGSPPPYSWGASQESPAATAAAIAMAGAGAEPRAAAPAAAPAPVAAAAAAAAGATRVVVSERPPSTEKEGSALRDALRRRQESFRRLEDVRAGARARLAALKAETEARRAAKSALKAKGDDGVKVPPAPSMDAPKAAAADDGGGGNVNPATGSSRIAIASRGSALPDSSAKLHDVDGFKALLRETVKVRSVKSFGSSGSSGSAAAAAAAAKLKDVEGFKALLRESAKARGVEDEEDEEGEEVQHGWDEVDLSGKGVRDEISAIMSLGTTAKNDNRDPTIGAAPALSAAATTREGGGPAGRTGQDRRASATEGGADVDGGITSASAASTAPPVGVSNDGGNDSGGGGGGGGGGDGKPQPRPSLSLDSLTEALGCAIDIAQVTDEEAGTESDSSAGGRESDLASSPQASPPSVVLRDEAARPPPARGQAAAAAPTGVGGAGARGRKRTPGTPADPPSGGPRTPPPPYQEGGGESAAAAAAAAAQGSPPAAAGAASSAITAAAAAVSAFFDADSLSDDPAAALSNASRRVSRLRELLGSVGEADAWSRLLSADGHLGCRRLAGLAFAGYSAAAAVAAAAAAAEPQASTAAAPAPAPGVDTRRCRLLCAGALECLAICGKISPGMWADLSKPDQSEENGGESNRLARLLSLCVALSGSHEAAAAAAARTGLNEHEYFFGKGSGGQGTGGEDERQEREPDLPAVGLTLIYEILTGVCKGRVEAFRCWSGMSNLVESLLGLIANQDREEGSYMGATRCLLAANHPFLRHRSPQATRAAADPATAVEVDGDNAAASAVLPALLDHLARHEVQGAVLHIFNEEGYPNGDAELARLCSVFCSDAFEKDRREDLFYVNDVKVMVDIILRELYNLPADDGLRADYLELLRSLLLLSGGTACSRGGGRGAGRGLVGWLVVVEMMHGGGLQTGSRDS